MSKLTYSNEIFGYIYGRLARMEPEWGGLLGSSDGKRIDRFYYDRSAKCTSTSYSPDRERCNFVIHEWEKAGVKLVGFLHSHPRCHTYPSAADLDYADSIMEVFGLDSFKLPIVDVGINLDGAFTMYDYTIYKDKPFTGEKEAVYEIGSEFQNFSDFSRENIFNRIAPAIPLDKMISKTVIGIGCGGASGAYEALARCGVTHFVLFDGDEFSVQNIASQDAYIEDQFLPKAKAIARRLMSINPKIKAKAFDEYVSVGEPLEGIVDKLPKECLTRPTDCVILACTDTLAGQTVAINLSMKLGIPFVGPQMYEEGKGAEITFYYPNVTPVCPRCILSSRFEAYENGYKNMVTSTGALYPTTMQTNAMTVQIALMCLLYEEDCRYFHLLDEVKNRNLVLLRMSPTAGRDLGLDYLDEAMDSTFSFFGEALWVPVKTHYDNCPLIEIVSPKRKKFFGIFG